MKVEEARCSNCDALAAQVADLQAAVVLLTEQVESLKEQLAKAKKDSSTSSKPPSSDIVKPKKKPGKGRRGKRKQGGQKGHSRHERPEFAPEMLDGAWEYHLSECPVCGDALLPSDEASKTIQQIEIIEKPIRIDEHRGLTYWCESCQKVHYAKRIGTSLVRTDLDDPCYLYSHRS